MGICTCAYNPQLIKEEKTLNIKIEPSEESENKVKQLFLNNQIMINKTFQCVSDSNKQHLIDNTIINDVIILHHCNSMLLEHEHSANDSRKSITSFNFHRRPIFAKLSRKHSNQV